MTDLPAIERCYGSLGSLLGKYERSARQSRFTGTSPEDFRLWQREARELLLALLGLDKMETCPLDPVLTESSVLPDGIRREHWLIRTEPGVVMPFYLLIPPEADRTTRPFLCPPGHGGVGKYSVAGCREYGAVAERIDFYNYDYGLQLARQGHVALCPDARGFGERRESIDDTLSLPTALKGDCVRLAHMGLPLGITVAGMQVWDLMRAADYLARRGDWAYNELGCLGFSGGGMQTLYLAALDERISLAVISGYLYGFRDSLLILNENCACNYVPHLWEHLDMGDIASLIAPRPLLIQSCREDRLNGPRGLKNVKEQVEIVREAYRLLDEEPRLLHEVCEGPHRWHGEKLRDNLELLLRVSKHRRPHTMDKLELREAILAGVREPEIPDRVTNAAALGILPDTGENLTKKLQGAIDELSRQGGGRLRLPAGVYRSGALTLQNGVELHLESPETILQFINTEIEENYPLVNSHWEASPCYNYSALLYANGAHDIAVTGQGVLDGGADREHWWNWHHQVEEAWSEDRTDMQLPDRSLLRRMNLDGVPVARRRFGPGHWLRPNFVQLLRCERVLIQGVTFKNSPMWQLNPVLCSSVIVDGVTLSSHGSNNDGCDPESCNGVWIKNCRFDTGDDCISLKSGRDRDGQTANIPCENILIENNDFLDGHGGIALGSEMSGGIRKVLASGNRFTSPRLTYALRLKTNARRGGYVEQVMLCDSKMDAVHGAAVHGTMLYEDGRNGDSLPVFRDVTIENIEAHGGDYGIFLEAFPEVPITGLVLRNIRIDGAERGLRAMNWQDPVIENVVINGKRYPRPERVRILGVPYAGAELRAAADAFPGETLRFDWASSKDGTSWTACGSGETLTVPESAAWLRVTAADTRGNTEISRPYRVLSAPASGAAARLICRNMLPAGVIPSDAPVTRIQLAAMLMPLTDQKPRGPLPTDTRVMTALAAAANRFLSLDEEGRFRPEASVTREEMASVAMQACGVCYRNASSTMPVCTDAGEVANNYGTNVARALYFDFMRLEEGRFYPGRPVTVREAIEILDRVADFAGI